MVIQRWQSLFLLIAAIFIAIFCFIPAVEVFDGSKFTELSPFHYPLFLALNIITAILLIASIFAYKNTRRQRGLIATSMVLIICSIIAGVFIFNTLTPGENGISCANPYFSSLLLLGALIMAFIAYRRVLADERLLRSYDRLR